MQTTLPRAALAAALTLGLGACSGSGGGSAPAAGDFSLATDRGARVTATPEGATNLLGSPAQREGLRLDTEPVVAPLHGELFLFEDGTFSYTHDDSAGGVDSFSFRAVRIDDPGQSSVGEVTVTITDPEPAPFAPTDDHFPQAIGNLPFLVGRPVGADLAVRISGSVLANDGGASAVVTAADLTSTSGAAVDMHPDGSFSVSLLPGFSGVDSFDYSVQDGDSTGSATVTLTVGTPIWFVDDNGGSSPGDGHSANPFRTLDELDAAQQNGAGTPGPGETIYLLPGSHSGSLTLLDGQTLHGSGVAFQRGGLRIAEGTPATVRSSSGDCITCADDNTVVGLRIGDTQGIGLVATDSSNLTVRNTAIVGNGQAFQLLRSSLDIELSETVSLSSAGRGLDVEQCSGTITIADAVTVNGSDAEGLRLVEWPAGSTFTVQGDVAIVAPALDEAAVFESVDGSFTSTAVRVSGRTKGAVRIDDCDGTLLLGDVDADNPNTVLGTPFAIQGGSATVRIASLDAQGVIDDDNVITDDQDPGYDVRVVEENGVALAIRDFEGTFEITGLGAQGNGGTLDSSAGRETVSVLRGSPDVSLAGLTIAGADRSGLLFDDNSGVVHLDRVTVLDFGIHSGSGLDVRGTVGQVAITMWECLLDGDTTDTRTPSRNGISVINEHGGNRTFSLILGDPDQPSRACTIDDCERAVQTTNYTPTLPCRVEAYGLTAQGFYRIGLEVQSQDVLAQNEVRVFDSVFESDETDEDTLAILLRSSDGAIRGWLRGNQIRGCYDGMKLESVQGSLSARVENNQVQDFTGLGLHFECGGSAFDAEAIGNTIAETTNTGNFPSGVKISKPGDARVLLEDNTITGTFQGISRDAPVYIDTSNSDGVVDVCIFDNTLGASVGRPYIMAEVADAHSGLRLLCQDQNGGSLDINHDAGSVGIEKLGTLGEDNSGMTLDVSGTAANVSALASGTVQRPTVILP